MRLPAEPMVIDAAPTCPKTRSAMTLCGGLVSILPCMHSSHVVPVAVSSCADWLSMSEFDHVDCVILMKCILGPIMNLSEFKDYRGELRKKIGFVQELVSVIEDDFEISYMAIGIIANLALDGPDVWNLV